MSAKIKLIAPLGAGVIKLLGLSWRMRYEDAHYLEEARRHSKNIMFAFWHGRLLPLSYAHRNESIRILASEHEDGELVGRTMRYMGYGHVRGSSTRGGARAIRQLVVQVKRGFDIGITVDGPRGPAYRVKPGPTEIARLSGAAIIPLTASAKRRKVFSSWDGFILPAPFTNVTVRYGRPVVVPGDADENLLEEKRLELEATLLEITAKNDEYYQDRG